MTTRVRRRRYVCVRVYVRACVCVCVGFPFGLIVNQSETGEYVLRSSRDSKYVLKILPLSGNFDVTFGYGQ